MIKNKFKNEGQGLLEAIIALTVAVLVIVGLVKVVITSINTNDFSKKKIITTHLAQQAMEKVRNYRDSNDWTTFASDCIGKNKTAMGIASSYDSIYTLTFDCSDPGPAPLPTNKRLVTITVSWSDTKGTHSSTQQSYFTKINDWK